MTYLVIVWPVWHYRAHIDIDWHRYLQRVNYDKYLIAWLSEASGVVCFFTVSIKVARSAYLGPSIGAYRLLLVAIGCYWLLLVGEAGIETEHHHHIKTVLVGVVVVGATNSNVRVLPISANMDNNETIDRLSAMMIILSLKPSLSPTTHQQWLTSHIHTLTHSGLAKGSAVVVGQLFQISLKACPRARGRERDTERERNREFSVCSLYINYL